MSAICAASSSAEWRADSTIAFACARAAVSRASWSAAKCSRDSRKSSAAFRRAASTLPTASSSAARSSLNTVLKFTLPFLPLPKRPRAPSSSA